MTKEEMDMRYETMIGGKKQVLDIGFSGDERDMGYIQSADI